jgi:arylsulfatase A-like enzyme
MRGIDYSPRPAYMETYGFGRDPNFFMRGLRMPEWKYIDSPTDPRVKPQLYSLGHDPHERKNVAKEYPEIVAQMKARLEGELQAAAPVRANEDWTDAESKTVEERLRDLGYF